MTCICPGKKYSKGGFERSDLCFCVSSGWVMEDGFAGMRKTKSLWTSEPEGQVDPELEARGRERSHQIFTTKQVGETGEFWM